MDAGINIVNGLDNLCCHEVEHSKKIKAKQPSFNSILNNWLKEMNANANFTPNVEIDAREDNPVVEETNPVIDSNNLTEYVALSLNEQPVKSSGRKAIKLRSDMAYNFYNNAISINSKLMPNTFEVKEEIHEVKTEETSSITDEEMDSLIKKLDEALNNIKSENVVKKNDYNEENIMNKNNMESLEKNLNIALDKIKTTEAHEDEKLNNTVDEALNKMALELDSQKEEGVKKMDYNNWETNFELAKVYYEHNHNLEIPYDFITNNGYEVTAEGAELGQWISIQKQMYQNGNLTSDQMAKLKSINIEAEDTYFAANKVEISEIKPQEVKEFKLTKEPERPVPVVVETKVNNTPVECDTPQSIKDFKKLLQELEIKKENAANSLGKQQLKSETIAENKNYLVNKLQAQAEKLQQEITNITEETKKIEEANHKNEREVKELNNLFNELKN